jgi:hypothetical protein
MTQTVWSTWDAVGGSRWWSRGVARLEPTSLVARQLGLRGPRPGRKSQRLLPYSPRVEGEVHARVDARNRPAISLIAPRILSRARTSGEKALLGASADACAPLLIALAEFPALYARFSRRASPPLTKLDAVLRFTGRRVVTVAFATRNDTLRRTPRRRRRRDRRVTNRARVRNHIEGDAQHAPEGTYRSVAVRARALHETGGRPSSVDVLTAVLGSAPVGRPPARHAYNVFARTRRHKRSPR